MKKAKSSGRQHGVDDVNSEDDLDGDKGKNKIRHEVNDQKAETNMNGEVSDIFLKKRTR